MASLPSAERIRDLLRAPRERLRVLQAHPVWRWAWRALTVLSIGSLCAVAIYTFREFPNDQLRVRPAFLALAFAVYLVTFVMQLFGWHSLVRLLFPPLPLRQNIEAVAASNLVKYLPTIAWYIANRAHYYSQRGVPQTRVVLASLYELGFMVGANASLLLVSWLASFNVWLALAALVGCVVVAALVAQRARTAIAHQPLRRWALAFLWYAATWPMAGLFLWAIIAAFAPLSLASLPSILHMWLLTSLAGYAVTLTLGAFGLAREFSLGLLLAQNWPLPVALAVPIAVKLMLSLGEVGNSLLILGVLRLLPASTNKQPPAQGQ